MSSLIMPGKNQDFSKIAKQAGAPPIQPQQIPLEQIIVEISSQVAQQVFINMIFPVETKLDILAEKLGIAPDELNQMMEEKIRELMNQAKNNAAQKENNNG